MYSVNSFKMYCFCLQQQFDVVFPVNNNNDKSKTVSHQFINLINLSVRCSNLSALSSNVTIIAKYFVLCFVDVTTRSTLLA